MHTLNELVHLYRPRCLLPLRSLQRFGEKLELGIGGLNFQPHVLIAAATGIPMMRAIERKDARAFRAMKSVGESLSGSSRPQERSRRFFDELLAEFSLKWCSSTQMLPSIPAKLWTPWRQFYRVARHPRSGFSPLERQLMARFAAEDRRFLRIEISANGGASERSLLASEASIQYWERVDRHVGFEAAVRIDRLLAHLAWLDLHGWPSTPGQLLRLADPSGAPMRHLFDVILNHTGCGAFPQLLKMLARNGVTIDNKVPSEDLLGHWSSDELPRDDRLLQMLKGVCSAEAVPALRRLFWAARLLTFIQEVNLACRTWECDRPTVRRQIYERLRQLVADGRSGRAEAVAA